jgi:hypothetical protein
MPNSTYAILDTETLCLPRQPGVVLEIGIIIYDAETHQEVEALEICPNMLEQLFIGLAIDHETLQWWQHPDRSQALLPLSRRHQSPSTLSQAVEQFRDILARHKPAQIWVRGADFDPPILRHLFADWCTTTDLFPRNARICDIRTAEQSLSPDLKETSFRQRGHTALEDCRADQPIVCAYLQGCAAVKAAWSRPAPNPSLVAQAQESAPQTPAEFPPGPALADTQPRYHPSYGGIRAL